MLPFLMISAALHRRAARFAVIAAALLSSSAAAAAQQADTLPFRGGQWGAEFSASDFAGVGALRFTSPRSAWLLDVYGRIRRQSGDNDDPSTPNIIRDDDFVQLRVGWRRYGVLAPRVVRHLGVGVLASRASADQQVGAFVVSVPFLPLQSHASTSLGAFAELGAQWMITPKLSLGASYMASVSGEWTSVKTTTFTPQGSTRSTRSIDGYTGALGPLAIRAAVYF
jgi:opacity protein-like surface antigen